MYITFILVNPSVPENIGAAARAIKTMGFDDLRLVNPCNHLCDKALMLAHGAHDILQKSKVYSKLSDAISDIDFSIATSAKHRWVKQNIIRSKDIGKFVKEKSEVANSLAMVFGSEESGLANEDIALCDRVAAIPIANPYPSLNLAQAVMVFAYSLSDFEISNETSHDEVTENHGFKALKARVKTILNDIGINESSLVHGRLLERLTDVSAKDINLLHSISVKIKENLKN